MTAEKLDKLIKKLENLHPKYIDLSLVRLKSLLKNLGNPHLNLPPVIHIAGTNGKGSTLSFIKNILIENNYNVHSYISPHLTSINERFVLSNKDISKKKLFSTLKFIESVNDKKPITFFEITTAAALYLFSKTKADFLILETGLGGRLDATNIINDSKISIITPISYDHQEFLGNSLEKITKEKLGIIKKNSIIIIGKQKNKVNNYIKTKIKKKFNKKLFYNKNFKILNINKSKFKLLLNKKEFSFEKPLLRGKHQIENAALAIASINEIKKSGYKILKKKIDIGIKKTKWPGRLELRYLKNIPVFLDGAHNEDGATKLANFLNNEKKTWFIIGMLKNKDINLFLKILKKNITGVIALKIPEEKNSLSSDEIYEYCKKLKIFCKKEQNIKTAKKYILNKVNTERVVVTGSLYLVGRVRLLFSQATINPIN